jgi:hypothetical protein
MWRAAITVVAAWGLKAIPKQLFTQVVVERHMKNHHCSVRHMVLQRYSIMWRAATTLFCGGRHIYKSRRIITMLKRFF